MTVDMPTSHHNHAKNPNQTLFIMTIIQPFKDNCSTIKRKETKYSLAHLRVFITYFGEILVGVDVGTGVGVSKFSFVPRG